jgi:hypothetical protein
MLSAVAHPSHSMASKHMTAHQISPNALARVSSHPVSTQPLPSITAHPALGSASIALYSTRITTLVMSRHETSCDLSAGLLENGVPSISTCGRHQRQCTENFDSDKAALKTFEENVQNHTFLTSSLALTHT